MLYNVIRRRNIDMTPYKNLKNIIPYGVIRGDDNIIVKLKWG